MAVMAQPLNNVVFEVYSGSLKKEDYDGSEASTCGTFDDAIPMKKQITSRSEASTRFSSEYFEEEADVPVKLTKDQVLSIGAELLQGFSAPDFQKKLQELLHKKNDEGLVPSRMELALTVQSKVLPRYGFPGTYDGVVMMLEAISPFMDDYMVQQMQWSIDEKLGMKAESSSPLLDGEMTKERVLSMAKELLNGFSTTDFQKKLQWLQESSLVLGTRKSATDIPGRMELALTVQSRVLPKYGFPGTSEGVVMMLGAVSQFMDDDMVQQALWDIEEKLGMHAQMPSSSEVFHS